MAEEGNLGSKSREDRWISERLSNSEHDKHDLWKEKTQERLEIITEFIHYF